MFRLNKVTKIKKERNKKKLKNINPSAKNDTFFYKRMLANNNDLDNDLLDDKNLIIRYDVIKQSKIHQNLYDMWIDKNISSSLYDDENIKINNKNIIFNQEIAEKTKIKKIYGNPKWLESKKINNYEK